MSKYPWMPTTEATPTENTLVELTDDSSRENNICQIRHFDSIPITKKYWRYIDWKDRYEKLEVKHNQLKNLIYIALDSHK